METGKVIYDFGAHNGDDIPYYLKKADRVVAVEANPVLCDLIRNRFAPEVSAGKVIVEDKVLAVAGSAPEVYFYVHKTNSVLSTFPQPTNLEAFDARLLPSCSPVDLIERYGSPYYIKIDIEHYDAQILRELFGAGIRPPFISAETHTVEVFAILLALGEYSAFKLVDGRSVPQTYGKAVVDGPCGPEVFSFPHHSAGPFGDDVLGPWLSASELIEALVLGGFEWKDIHASLERSPEPTRLRPWHVVSRSMRKMRRDLKRSLTDL